MCKRTDSDRSPSQGGGRYNNIWTAHAGARDRNEKNIVYSLQPVYLYITLLCTVFFTRIYIYIYTHIYIIYLYSRYDVLPLVRRFVYIIILYLHNTYKSRRIRL